MPHAGQLMRSVLVGMEELFARTGVPFWEQQVRTVAALDTPSAMARAYRAMSQGSAPGTFHDLLISVRNQAPITELQEPFVNEVLSTFQSLGLACMNAIHSGGDEATLGRSTAEAAGEHWLQWQGHDLPSRWPKVVTGVRCTTCDSRYQLDDASAWAAALRWSLITAPAQIEAGRSRELVDAALDPRGDPDTLAQLDAMGPAFERLGLPVIPLPYNRPGRAPNHRCLTCGADSWTTIHWLLLDDPIRLEAFPE